MNINKMVRLIFFFILISSGVSACSASGPVSVSKQAINASLHGDCEDVAQYLTSDLITNSGGKSAIISQCQDVYNQQIQDGNKIKSLKVIETVTEGNGAMVIFNVHWEEGQTTSISVMLDREDNQWKIWKIF